MVLRFISHFCQIWLISITSTHEDRIWKRKSITRRYASLKFWNMKVVLPSSCQHVNFGQDVVFCFAVFCFHRGLTFCQVLSSWLLAAHLPLETPWPQFLFWRRCETAFKATAFTPASLRNTVCIVRQNNTPGCELSNFTSYLWPATAEQLHNKYITTT